MAFSRFTVLALIGLFACPPLPAQQPADQASAWRTFAEQLEPGALVLVRLNDGTRLTGTVVQVSAGVLRVQPKTRLAAPVQEFQLAQIASIERRASGMRKEVKILIWSGVVELLLHMRHAPGVEM